MYRSTQKGIKWVPILFGPLWMAGVGISVILVVRSSPVMRWYAAAVFAILALWVAAFDKTYKVMFFPFIRLGTPEERRLRKAQALTMLCFVLTLMLGAILVSAFLDPQGPALHQFPLQWFLPYLAHGVLLYLKYIYFLIKKGDPADALLTS